MMRKKLLTLFTLLAISTVVKAQNVYIPDANFKNYLLGNAEINTNGDTEIQISEAAVFTGTINCPYLSISDLTGIEAFTALTYLYCHDNLLSNLDVSQNTALEYFSCFNNLLSSLDVSQNTALRYLHCSGNSLTGIDVSQNTALTHFTLHDNLITNLDVTQNTALRELRCNNNQLSSIDVSQNPALIKLLCYENPINSLDVTQNPALIELRCNNNQISSLDVTQNTLLYHLNCNINSLDSLDVTQNTILKYLYCAGNSLTTLDLTQNIILENILCIGNSLSSLDLPPSTVLNTLNCSLNLLENLDLSQNPGLTHVYCNDNLLTHLGLTENPALESFFCHNNSLTSLNIASGNNTHILGGAFGFNATANPDLSCIKIDAGFTPPMGWLKDATASYSDTCLTFVNSIIVQGQGGVSTITTSGGTLQMEALLTPTNPDNPTYTWSVENGSGSATISANGLLTASSNGTVIVTASANDASGVSGTKTITISYQTVGINDLVFNNLSIFPNPTTGLINLDFIETLYPIAIGSVRIMSLSGKVIKEFNADAKQLDISTLNTGIYFLEIANEERRSIIKIVKL